MTDEELEHIERLLKHPPSASLPAELGLRLVAEVRELKSALRGLIRASTTPPEPIASIETVPHTAATAPEAMIAIVEPEPKHKRKGHK